MAERIQFPGIALTSAEVAAHALSERQVDGFYMKEIVYPHGYTVPVHSHLNASLFIVFRGYFKEVYGSKQFDCKPLDVVLTPAGETHSEYLDKAGTRSFVFEFEPRWLNRLRDRSVTFNCVNLFRGGPVAWSLMKICREYRQMDEVSPLAIEGLALEMAAIIARLNNKQQISAPRWLIEARELLHDCFSERLSLEAIAHTVGVHPVYLATAFHRHYGCTIGDYVRRLRVDFACRELVRKKDTLVDIALSAGFTDQSHLTKTFKRITGMSPAQFRKTSRTA